MPVKLPSTPRARAAYNELRKMGFSSKYSRSVVETLEKERSNFEKFADVQGLLQGSGENTQSWLKRRGYL